MVSIIIVEDEFIIQMFLDNVIKELGYTNLGMFNNGEDTLRYLEIRLPDIILLDTGIRGTVDGIELAQIIKEKYKLPFLFLTGNTDKNTYDRILATDPICILKKPIDAAVLKQELRRICKDLNLN